jgi:RNA-binding protein
MLKAKQKRYLRSLAQTTKPIMQIGKNCITENFIETFEIQLDAHELIKVSVLQNCVDQKEALAQALSEKTRCELVQIIGNQLIFYRKSRKEDLKHKIDLPV